ncbi:hypothetical protein Ndes2526A_g04121 [Nannochloris sp. 'desiccata']
MDPAVGSRLLVGKHGATIRYVGPVEGQDGVWVGLEWDDPTRGKHDGRHSGTRYFSCLRHTHSATTAGSFVRLPKLIATADLGQSLETAIQSRYKINTDEHNNIKDDPEVDSEAYVPTASNRRVQIRLVGAAAMAALVSQDGALEHASFIDQRISNLALTTQMGIPFLRNIATLDLSNNLIGNWLAVAELLQLFPKLHTLNLSGNLLDIDSPNRISSKSDDDDNDDDASNNSVQLPSLKTLVLNNCGIRWSQVVFSLSRYLPHLTALHLCRNNITKLEMPSEVLDGKNNASTEEVHVLLARKFPKLETLDLEDNLLSEWNEIAEQVHALPRLKTLLLSGNFLKTITYPCTRRDSTVGIDNKISSTLFVENNHHAHGGGGKNGNQTDEACGGFRSLEHLMVGSNQLHGWNVADELDKFPSLIDVRISNNPLTNTAAKNTSRPSEAESTPAGVAFPVRYELIARISKLQMLNGSDIRAGERQDAELAYLRLITDEVAEAKAIQTQKGTAEEHKAAAAAAAAAAVIERHPKFSSLVAKYGELTASGPSSSQGTTLSSSMVELVFILGAKQVKKKVPTTLTIGRLKPLLERVLRIKLGHQCISLVDTLDGSKSEDVTSQDGKELGFYGVANGWSVEVGKRDVAAAVAAKGAMVAEQERRMEEHERGLQRLRAEEERLMVG